MRALLAISATLVLFATGCGSDDSDSSSSPSSESTSTPAAADGGATATAVAIKDFAFGPKDITVKVGQKITWTNEDSATHDVDAADGTFESEDLEQGDTFEYTADKAGTFAYVCSFHPNMKATLTVQ